ncbi:MAG: DNA topoisomerase 4 subunit A, partial [Chloroflexi bacterium]|nr:DNA topoisomerase 4 subunit A [Chloroflexota bacterium]
MPATPSRVVPVDIVQEMQQAYLDYAMSVIVARALPDARDGLKPVQRRLLYAMYQMGLTPDKPHRKSARIVGEVLGKYHPHGDQAVYEALARMAQPFSMRYPLVDGQGNFGSVDGDPPAAMRYTEARLAPIALELLRDLGKATVDWAPNFDGSLEEPTVLPAALPNLLVNGSTGIAVGMATNIPPHNLGEVVDALVYMLEHWRKLDEVGLADLMRFIPGPDFPTGGEIVTDAQGDDGLRAAYSTGRGRIRVRGRAHLETPGRGRQQWVVTELPYTVNKARWIEQVANLVRNGKLQGLTDLRDESDRRGMRVVLMLAKGTDPQAVLADLFRQTALETTYSIILLALVDGTPRVLSLKQMLRVYLEHRLEVVRRRSEHELGQLRQRRHILEGLLLALKHLDEVIAIIRRSRRADTARDNLRKRFKLSVAQAQAILDMPLRRLAALERKKLEEEYRAVKKRIRELERLLRSPAALRQAVAAELRDIKARYGDPRRTRLGSQATATGPVWVVADAAGRLTRLPAGVKPKTWGRD